MLNGVDKEGNLYLTYEVSVQHHGKTVMLLGTGSSAVSKFYNIAEAGIPGAKETEFLFNLNVLVTLDGECLLNLLKVHYPGKFEDAKNIIDPKEEYVIDCYDMS